MKTEDVAESHQTDFLYTFPAGHETKVLLMLIHMTYQSDANRCSTIAMLGMGKIRGASHR